MANANIKISQLPDIGSNLDGNTLLPVVSTNGTYITDKTTVGSIANFILTQAGNTFPEAFVSQYTYAVVNSAQPNITSVGNLTGLTVTNLANLHVPGGTNGYVLQTNGDGNLNWTAMSGSGNGNPGGANTQVQFNDEGLFGGNPGLTFDKTTDTLGTVNLLTSNATVYENLYAGNALINDTLTSENVAANNFTANSITITGNVEADYFIGNGSALTGITATANGAGPNTSIQFNNDGIFDGDANLTWDAANIALNTVNINAINITGNVSANILETTYLWSEYLHGDGSNITNISSAAFAENSNVANVANTVAVANITGIGNIAVVSLDGSTSNVLYGNGTFAPVVAELGNLRVNGTTIEIATPGATESEITIQPSGNNASYAYLYLPHNRIANTVNSSIRNDSGNVEIRSGTLSVGGGVYTWLFKSDGNLQFPDSTLQNTAWTGSVDGANVTGEVGLATYATTANSVAGPNVSGQVSYAAVANSISVSNVAGIGNISTINLDGNSSNILYGNGVFDSVPNPFNQDLNTTDNVTFANVTSTDSLRFTNLGNVVGAIGYAPTYLSIEGWQSNSVKITTNDVYSWTFGSDSNLTFPDATTQNTAWTGTVAAANVTGLGNIATINLDGNTSNVLYGNGAFSALTAGTTLVNGNSNVVVNAKANVIISTNGNAAVMDIGADGRVRMLTGQKQLGGNLAAGDGYIQFSTGSVVFLSGNVQLLGGGYIKGPGGTSVIQLNSPESSSARIVGNLAVGASGTANITAGNITLSGNISGNTNGYAIGYLNIPQVVASNTTLAATDGGKHYYSTTAGNLTLTIPNNATTSFATGTAISIVVQAAGNVLVNADTGVTLYMAGSSTAGNRVVGSYGMATLMKVASDTWFINGTGVY